ncbi:MAG: hypothetical protein PHV13_02085 [Candidatus ainarchaeum sp.]|nr:hypothetical protein [Candidatus ainarchaeum sp.]
MRGFVITLLSVSLILVLVVLTMSLRSAHLGTERALLEPLPLLYAAFLLDDAAYEFNSIVGPSMSFSQGNGSMNVTVADTLHAANHSAAVLAYGTFLESEVAGRTSSNITTNLSNISGGAMRVFINEDYVYLNNHSSGEVLFTRAGGTNATSYEINFTVYSIRQNITHMDFNSSGTLNVTIRYTDLNGTGTEQGSVFPGQANQFVVGYPNGTSMAVTVGLAGGEPGSLRMEGGGAYADFAWTAALPRLDPSKRRGYAYDATIEYVQGAVAKRTRFGK